MTREEKLIALERWRNSVMKADAEMEAFKAFGITHDGRIGDAIGDAVDALTQATAQLVGDGEFFWLDWYRLDCLMGKRPLDSVIGQKTKKIKTLKDLLWAIEESQ